MRKSEVDLNRRDSLRELGVPLEEAGDERALLLLPGVAHELADVRVLLGGLGDELLVVVMEIGRLQVLLQRRIEHRELSDAVPEAEALLHGEERQLGRPGGAQLEAVAMECLAHGAE